MSKSIRILFSISVLILASKSLVGQKILITNDSLIVAFHTAMSYYPELQGQKIRLQYGRITTSMAAHPRILSIFNKRNHRTYKIVVNKNLKKAQAQLVYDAPFDAQVGIMGHELAHIVDYTHQSGFGLIRTGIGYLSKKYRRKLEYKTDSVAISRGLGPQIHRFATYVLNEADISPKYRAYKLMVYMKPEEIEERIASRQ
ncbi:MAG: hypothetical protein LBC84_03255 [Prevotellaceae bacterium]|jgi:hypothetical protein|nr:hypothetical protein [Prevotellaceae bacterium]